ncbi:hypothetical protein BS50DRAFT_50725 [Corynespora cassiicola Philippines]|uniref:Uncharacterized protein n=1 Tax=Corynespora cassiicola Philippines TaxID=1448308 RepID=A0A2T2NI18_CORCC|nr:hypothetical protein BS50DRAFT_50725 [Corynespora cassiicola Philippines]
MLCNVVALEATDAGLAMPHRARKILSNDGLAETVKKFAVPSRKAGLVPRLRVWIRDDRLKNSGNFPGFPRNPSPTRSNSSPGPTPRPRFSRFLLPRHDPPPKSSHRRFMVAF